MTQRKVLLIDAGHQTFDELTDDDLATAPGGGGAPTDAQYLVAASSAGLSAEVVVTAAGLALLDDAAASNQRTTLGLAIGTDVRAQGSGDPTLASLGGAPSDVPYLVTTASAGLSAEVVVPAAVLTVLDDTTVGAMVDTLGGASATGTGGLVRATSPLLVTPALGTPASGVATNLTGTAAGLTAGTVTTNANLTGDVTSVGNATTIGAGKVTEAMQVLADNATQDVSTAKHGYAPKAPNDATKFLNGVGAYAVPPGTGLTNPMTTAADLIVGGASGVPARLAKGADGTVLTVDPTTHLLVWTAPSGGAPSGAAGGGLSGTYPNPTVATNANLTGPVTSVGNATTIADAELAAIAGLTSAADKLPYFTGSGTAALADLSSFIRTLLDDTTAAIARATLGVVNDPWTEIQTTADQTVTNSAVLVDHTGGGGPALTFTAVSGGMYHVNLFLIYSGNDATGDFRFNFTLPTISGWHRWGTGFGASETLTVNTGALANGLNTFGADLIAGADGVGDTPRIVFYEMWFRAGASSAFTLKFANSVASSGRTSTVRTGSVLRYRRLV